MESIKDNLLIPSLGFAYYHNMNQKICVALSSPTHKGTCVRGVLEKYGLLKRHFEEEKTCLHLLGTQCCTSARIWSLAQSTI